MVEFSYMVHLAIIGTLLVVSVEDFKVSNLLTFKNYLASSSEKQLKTDPGNPNHIYDRSYSHQFVPELSPNDVDWQKEAADEFLPNETNFDDPYIHHPIVKFTPHSHPGLPKYPAVGLGIAVAAILPLTALALYVSGGLHYHFPGSDSSDTTCASAIFATSTVTSVSISVSTTISDIFYTSTVTTTDTYVSTEVSTSVSTVTQVSVSVSVSTSISTILSTETYTSTSTVTEPAVTLPVQTVTTTLTEFYTDVQTTTVLVPTTITFVTTDTSTFTSTIFDCTSIASSTVTETSTRITSVSVTDTTTVTTITTLIVPTTVTVTSTEVTTIICCACNPNDSTCNCLQYPNCSDFIIRKRRNLDKLINVGPSTLPIEPTLSIMDISHIQMSTYAF